MVTAKADNRLDTRAGVVPASLLPSAVRSLDDGRRHLVLDLGVARQGVLNMLAGLRCRIDVVGLPDRLSAGRTCPAETGLADWFHSLFPAACGERASLVLCWNLLDALPLADVQVLATVLAARAHPHCRLHAVVRRTANRGESGQVSAVVPEGGEYLRMDASLPEGSLPAAGHPLSELERHMVGFRYEHGRLLANGMQELLLQVDRSGG